MHYRSSLVKLSVLAIVSIIGIGLLGNYVVPRFFFCYASGVVDHKKIGYTLDGNTRIEYYTVSIRLSNDDLINNHGSGTTFAYIVSKFDWDIVQNGDTVRIKILPDLKAQLV